MYYGLSLVGNFGLDIYLTQFIFGAVEIPARLGSFFLIQYFGRRKCLLSMLVIGGCSCLVILAVPPGTTSCAEGHVFLVIHVQVKYFLSL